MERINPNEHTIQFIISALKAKISNVETNNTINISRTELDSHANMVVLGKESFIFESTGKTCNVEPFSIDLGIAQDIPIVDAALA